MPQHTKTLWLGAHCSAAGGVHQALLEGERIGATCIQLFTANQRRWQSGAIDPDEVARWQDALHTTGIRHVMSHDSYLINLGAPNPEILEKSRHAFEQEIHRCRQLKIPYLNFHPGAALDQPREQCADRIIASLRLMRRHLPDDGSLTLVAETTAGQGSSYGSTFEELGTLTHAVHHEIPIGVCIDTCHIFVAGYDIRTPTGWNHTLEQFDRTIGLRFLKAMHLNDSVKGLGSRVDRHRPLGEGMIGMESFQFVMQDKRLCDLPKYLETPDGPDLWVQELQLLREFAHAR
ncbi:MAG: deoxyribonuclease IV [Chlamydiia bacterium]